MTDLTPEQRARALKWRNTWAANLSGREAAEISLLHYKAWLAVEKEILSNHTCESAWRPTTRDEIQKGWEVRSRRRNGSEAGWGVAHHQDDDGDWITETGRLLTFTAAGWTNETTAPKPKPNARVVFVANNIDQIKSGDYEAAAYFLARLDAITEDQ